MRIRTSLSVTPEDSLEDIPAVVEGIDSEQVSQQTSTNAEGMVTTVAPLGSVETRPKVVSESDNQGEVPGGTEVTREASREDALVATRHFFHIESEGQSAAEVPATTTTSQSQTDIPPVISVPVETENPEPLTSKKSSL